MDKIVVRVKKYICYNEQKKRITCRRGRQVKKYGFGVDVGGTTVKMGFFETDGRLVDKWEIKTNTF